MKMVSNSMSKQIFSIMSNVNRPNVVVYHNNVMAYLKYIGFSELVPHFEDKEINNIVNHFIDYGYFQSVSFRRVAILVYADAINAIMRECSLEVRH